MQDATPRIPSVGNDPREQSGEVAEPPGKIWFRNLDEAVIEADRCIQCGTCVAACPSNSIGIDPEENQPTLVRMCTGCSSCWDYCPRSGLRYERIVALNKDERWLEEPAVYEARAGGTAARRVGQDGGVVTELLATLLETGVVDGVVAATEQPSAPLRGVATLATSREELIGSAGSTYNQTMQLGRIDELVDDAGLEDPDLALVGTPCVIEGASALERYDHTGAHHIALTVALMCTRNFRHSRLVGMLTEHGVDPAAVEKLDVSRGVLYAYDDEGSVLLDKPVDEFSAAGLRGCDECADFVGGAADISAGSVGSPDDATTIVVRTERGEQAWAHGRDALTISKLIDTDSLRRITEWNERSARTNLQRSYDTDGPIGISYEEHRSAYDGTDRAPEALNPARVYQYDEWC